MSLSLLKKSMAIVEQDLRDSKKSKEKDVRDKRKSKIQKQNRFSNEIFPKNQAQKKNMDEIRKELEMNNSRAEENVNKLLKLSKYTIKIRDADKILQRAQTGKYIVNKKKEPVPEQESLFTEQDFADFEKELANTVTESNSLF